MNVQLRAGLFSMGALLGLLRVGANSVAEAGRPPFTTAEDEANEAARLQMIAARNAAAIHAYVRSPVTSEYGTAWQQRNT